MAEEQHDTIDDLSTELRRFPPPEGFKADALVTGTDLYDEAAKDDEGFWANRASELITGRTRGTPSSNGTCRTRSGSSVAS